MLDRDVIRALPGYTLLSESGRGFFERAMDAPSRGVAESALLNVSGEFPSQDLGETVQYESRGCEKYYVLMSKLDPTIHCILDQAPKLAVIATNKLGNRSPKQIRLDFIECGSARFCLVEAKPRGRLLSLKKNCRGDWVEEAENCWRYLPGEKAAEALGFDFKIFCPEAYPPAALANLRYRHLVKPIDVARSNLVLLNKLRSRVEKRPHTVRELSSLYDGATGGLLFQAIEQGYLFGLLQHQLFDLDFVIYGSAAEAALHRQSLARMTLPVGNPGPLSVLHQRASLKALAEAREKMERYDDDRKANAPMTSTAYRQSAKVRQAKAEGSPRIAAFIPDYMNRGSKEKKLDVELRDQIKKFIKKYWRESDHPTIAGARGRYEEDPETKAAYVPSKETFRRLFHEALTPARAAFLAGGRRAFHKARPMTDGRHAVPEPEIVGLHVHLDGVYGDRYSKAFEELSFLRPIYYPLVDDVSGYVFARGVKIGAPSRMPVAMALRDCYQRHGFVPSEIIRDGGSEFANAFFSELAANLDFINEKRPSGAPQFGGRGESFNAAFNKHLQSLVGGSYFDQAGRSADGNKKGRRRATEEVAQLVRDADRWIFDVWNTTPIGGETKSPEQLLRESLRAFPEAVRSAVDSPQNRYLTSMPLGIASFSYGRGVRWGGMRFSSDDLAAVLERGEMPVGPRLDVMEPTTIWAMTRSGPVALYARKTTRTGGADFGGRLALLKKLMGYNMNAADNQHLRNAKAARQHREAEISAAIAEPREAVRAVAVAERHLCTSSKPESGPEEEVTFLPFARKRARG